MSRTATSNTTDIIESLTELIARARTDQDVEVVYVNDNYGNFTADFAEIVRSARNGARPDLVETRCSRAAALPHELLGCRSHWQFLR